MAGEVNAPPDELAAIRAIDARALDRAIEACLDARRIVSALREFRLDSCGPFVAAKLREFDAALQAFASTKASKKLADTGDRARRAGSNLDNTVRQMQHRIDAQEQEGERFFIDDHVMPPSHFSKALVVPVHYRWRPSAEAKWTHGTITFIHMHDPRPDYSAPRPKRMPSASQQARDLQQELWREWEQLMKNALLSLVEYFRQGGDGTAIPKIFQARVNPYDRRLNNFSCRFWLNTEGKS